MKPLWIFLLGATNNLGFIFVILISYGKSEYSNEPGMTKPGFPIYAIVIGMFLLAGILARHFDHPGSGNILVMIVSGLAVLIACILSLAAMMSSRLSMCQIGNNGSKKRASRLSSGSGYCTRSERKRWHRRREMADTN